MHCKNEKILFLDDNEENISGAKNCGIKTIKVNKGMDLFEEINNWLELNN